MAENTEKKEKRKVVGPFRNFGWKRDLCYMVIGALIMLLMNFLLPKVYNNKVLEGFDLSMAITPLIGFSLGIWGVLGYLMGDALMWFVLILQFEPASMDIVLWAAGSDLVSMLVYSLVPAILWYAIKLPGEKSVKFPRMDTSAHVLKYYLIMLASVALYIAASAAVIYYGADISVVDWAAMFTRYLDVVLVVGILLIIILSAAHHRSVTINERLVLAFLFVGVIASLIAGFIIYRVVYRFDPALFKDYFAITDMFQLDESAQKVIDRYMGFWNMFYIVAALMLNILLIVEMLFMRSIEKKVTKPILHLTDVLAEYTEQEEKTEASRMVAERSAPYMTGYGEVSKLTKTCVTMVDEIENYTENLQQVTSERERIGAELDVASKIQKDMLPNIFPPFPDRREIELYAGATPAKEVGGDFYDFYMIDHDHLVLTIADVSGKGVPASLFMVISKTLLKNHAQSSTSPREILSFVNHQLVQNNESHMFCTVWLGILDLKSGRLTASNAGHEYPLIKRAAGGFELFQDKHGLPLGIRDGVRYDEYEVTLGPGDWIFQYTDGVTEATNAEEELFGTERLLEALRSLRPASPEEVIDEVNRSIGEFVQDAPQFDDITMLCLEYRGGDPVQDKKQAVLKVPAKVEHLGEVTEFVEQELEKTECPPDILFAMTLSVEEIFVNIASYAYEGREPGDAWITFAYDEAEKEAELVFTDNGIPFDPTAMPEPDISKKASERPIGGLGIHIVKNTMDSVAYEYTGGQNILTIRKKYTEEAE